MPHKQQKKARATKLRGTDHRRQVEDDEITKLRKIIEAGKPAKGTNPLAETAEPAPSTSSSSSTSEAEPSSALTTTTKKGKKEKEPKSYTAARTFDQLPISHATKRGLTDANYRDLTDIQRASIPHALAGRDVLGAAKTGSGKTLAFVVPLLEKLFHAKWTPRDGLGGLIISPTRELALQIFEVLRAVGKYHCFSAGLVIGGKDLKSEQSRIGQMNILVCTPGRLLQHMDQTFDFDCSNIQMLVLDEADRILDLGFSKTLNAIVANLPTQRQTLLFSATQTKSIRDLARLSLVEPEYISVHEQAKYTTPNKLQQYVVVIELHDKTDFLYSFIKRHLRTKCIVFFSSCKQVRFMYESFRQVRPGIPLMELHGKMKQMKRMAVFLRFCESNHAMLFATDIAARGLDFPSVDWVIQMDCPEDVATYIHRVGRTARYEAVGKSLLALLPSEQNMIQQLHEKKVPVEQIKVNPQHSLSIKSKIAGFVSQDPDLKYLAQKALISYMRSVFLQSNKDVFQIEQLDLAKYAESLGLATVPQVRFNKGQQSTKNKSRDAEAQAQQSSKKKKKAEDETEDRDSEDDDDDEEEEEEDEQLTKIDKLFRRKNAGVLSEARLKILNTNEEDSDDDLLVLKRKAPSDVKKVVAASPSLPTPSAPQSEALKEEREKYLKKIRDEIQAHDAEDKKFQLQRRREKKRQLREAERIERAQAMGQSAPAQLVPYYDDEEEDSDEDQEESESEEAAESSDEESSEEEAAPAPSRKRSSTTSTKDTGAKSKKQKTADVDPETLAESILRARGVL